MYLASVSLLDQTLARTVHRQVNSTSDITYQRYQDFLGLANDIGEHEHRKVVTLWRENGVIKRRCSVGSVVRG